MDQNLSSVLTAPSQRTLSDYVADQLRQAILVGQLQPAQRLVEEDLATSLQTSRGPVRDAIRMLENEGLVIRQPHRGAFVADWTPDDVREIYSLREALESLAIRYVIKNATDEQIDELENLVHEMNDLAQHEYTQIEATDIDMTFHRALCQISGHRRLLNAWESISAQIRLVVLKHRLRNPADFRDRGISWHENIVECLRHRETDCALQELERHMAVSIEWLIKSMEASNGHSQ
jgi:DNA-binding GntR family transcriptional regulator